MVNRYTDAKARKTPCSISLPNEMWGKIDEYILEKYGGRLNRSEFFEDFIRQTLEDKAHESGLEDPSVALSVNTGRAYIHRLKDFIAANSKEKKVGNLEALRLDLAEASIFCDQEIRRSRSPTKSDKREEALRQAITAHQARIDNNGVVVINAPTAETASVENPDPDFAADPTQEQKSESEPDPVDLEYERIIQKAYADYKEPPPPPPDYEIIDEGRTKQNPYDNSGSEVVFT